jgi:fluoroquinolone transport system ATP-binding protein
MIFVDGLTYTYPASQTPAVAGVDFAINEGEIFGLLGPSGAGKSTTQRILTGLLPGYGGSVRVLDREVGEQNREFYERIGVSFELPNHYLKLTALENLRFFASLYQGPTESPQAVLEMVGLEADGDKRVSQFSKGMRNRLTVARSLLHRPQLLFLDEPTSGLDPVNTGHIRDLIRARRSAGATVFLTTHNMAVAEELCDRVAFMVEGRIVLIDTPRALKLRYGQRIVDVEHRDGGTDGGSTLATASFPLDEIADDPRFLQLLRSGSVETIHTRESSLDRIFVEVTGQEVR